MTAASLGLVRLRDALHAARARNASDLHLGAGLPPVLRIDGVLEALSGAALCRAELEEIVASLVGPDHSRGERDDVSVAWDDGELGSMRVHAFRAAGSPAVAIRLLGDTIPALESLALPEIVATLAQRTHGLLVFAGPTGSGKSTTMAALVDRMNRSSARRIITIEDPIEYRHASACSVISQREVGSDTPNLAAALRGALRSDPDVIVVGEVRDGRAIREALIAAETGHLVLVTLHTASAAGSIDRIVDAFEGALQAQVRGQLAQVLVGVVCQHLVRRASGRGRQVVVEILLATDAVRNLIREARNHLLKNAIATGRQFGMQTLEQHLFDLVRRGEIRGQDARGLDV